MCLIHKWTYWEQYKVESFIWENNEKTITSVEKRQKRKCSKCNKEQDELVTFIS